MKTKKLYEKVIGLKPVSAWEKGVRMYALDLIETLEENGGTVPDNWVDVVLNGARYWQEYSEGGCSLIYDEDIAKRLCTPSELHRTKNGTLRPNSRESWLDVQARALYSAQRLIARNIER